MRFVWIFLFLCHLRRLNILFNLDEVCCYRVLWWCVLVIECSVAILQKVVFVAVFLLGVLETVSCLSGIALDFRCLGWCKRWRKGGWGPVRGSFKHKSAFSGGGSAEFSGDAFLLSGVKTKRFLPHQNSQVFTAEESPEKWDIDCGRFQRSKEPASRRPLEISASYSTKSGPLIFTKTFSGGGISCGHRSFQWPRKPAPAAPQWLVFFGGL